MLSASIGTSTHSLCTMEHCLRCCAVAILRCCEATSHWYVVAIRRIFLSCCFLSQYTLIQLSTERPYCQNSQPIDRNVMSACKSTLTRRMVSPSLSNCSSIIISFSFRSFSSTFPLSALAAASKDAAIAVNFISAARSMPKFSLEIERHSKYAIEMTPSRSRYCFDIAWKQCIGVNPIIVVLPMLWCTPDLELRLPTRDSYKN